MNTKPPNLLTLSALALIVSATAVQAQFAYSISGETTLIRFDLSSPGTVVTIGNFSGAATGLSGLDFRVSNGLLYGIATSGGLVVTIDPSTAFTTLVSTLSTAPASFNFGIDFNPQVVITPGVLEDRLRLVEAGTEQNLRANVTTGATTVDGVLAYAAGDANFGRNPEINEAAYLNNDTNINTPTTLYYLDHAQDVLATTSAPNSGTITTVGPLGVNTDLFTGFDIFTDDAGLNTAYAVLRPAGSGLSALYTIDLSTGAATAIGNIAAANVFSFAVQPVPEPASLGLFAAGAIGLLGLRRRRG